MSETATVLPFQPAPPAPANEERVPHSIDEVRSRITHIMAFEGLKQAAIATASGVAAPTLSGFLKGTYKGDMQATADRLGRYLDSRARGAAASAGLPIVPDYLPMPTGEKILAALGYAQVFGDIAAIYGGRGLGKTAALRRYRATNPNVFLVTATPETSSVGTILEEIAIALGLRDMPLHPARLRREIDRKIADTSGLLVIDEAQHLTKQALESIRGIHDRIGIGLALLGNVTVYNRLYGTGNKSEDFAQLYSRIGKRLFLQRPLAGDVHAIAAVYGIDGSKGWHTARLWLEQIAMKPGGLRGVAKTLRLAATYALGAGEKLGFLHLQAAWAELQGAAEAASEAAC